VTWLVEMLDDATRMARLRVGADLMMLHTLEGVVHDLGAKSTKMDETLLREFILQLHKELPERCFYWPNSRAFATRLSTIDIIATLLSLPVALARSWQALWLEVLRP